MGVLEDLLRQMQEAAEQGQRTTMPGTPRPAAPAQSSVKRVRQPVPAADPAPRPPVVEVGEDPVHRLVADTLPAHVAYRIENPLLARLRDPTGLRDAVILSEILRRPSRRR